MTNPMTDTTALLSALHIAAAALTESAMSRESDLIDCDDEAEAAGFRAARGTLNLFAEAVADIRQGLDAGTASLGACVLTAIERTAQRNQMLDVVADLRRDLAAAEAARDAAYAQRDAAVSEREAMLVERDEARVIYCDAEAECVSYDHIATSPETIAEEHGWQYLLPMLADRREARPPATD